MITEKDITDIDVKETVKNTTTVKTSLRQSITIVSITKTEMPSPNMTLGMTSKTTFSFVPGKFERLNSFV